MKCAIDFATAQTRPKNAAILAARKGKFALIAELERATGFHQQDLEGSRQRGEIELHFSAYISRIWKIPQQAHKRNMRFDVGVDRVVGIGFSWQRHNEVNIRFQKACDFSGRKPMNIVSETLV